MAISNGIHARPSHALVSLAVGYDSEIQLRFDGRSADAKSILAVMTLGAPCGAHVEIAATGADATQAANAVVALLENSELGDSDI